MHICVLGAGVIGVTTAHRLLEEGHEVTLVEAAARPGSGASFGNGAQLSYSYVAPLADPSVWTKWPYYLFSPNSPLTLRPKLDPVQWRWLSQFLAACNSHQVQQTTVALLKLAFLSRQELSALRHNLPLQFDHRVAGKLVMFSDEAGLQAGRNQVAFQAEHGCEQQVLNLDRCLEIEPALAHASRRWVGGVYTKSEEVGNCEKFCQDLVEQLKARPSFTFLSASPVSVPVMKNRRLTAVQAGDKKVEADVFVLAMGNGSRAFARQLGFSLPLYPLKGYSITVPLEGVAQERAPQVSITDLSKKIVYARVGDRLRVAGRVELVGDDQRISPKAIDELKQSTEELFPGSIAASDRISISPWAGFRPATPRGLPIIGSSPVQNLYLNVGHGSLGWTLACGSAALLAQILARQSPAIEAEPFQFAGA